MEVNARVLLEPRGNLGRAVGRRVVEHDVQLSTWVLARDQLHETQKISSCMAIAASVGYLTVATFRAAYRSSTP